MRPLGPHYNVFFDVAEALCLEYVFVVAACGPLGRRTKPHVLIVRTKNKDCFKSTFNIQTTLPKTQDILESQRQHTVLKCFDGYPNVFVWNVMVCGSLGRKPSYQQHLYLSSYGDFLGRYLLVSFGIF